MLEALPADARLVYASARPVASIGDEIDEAQDILDDDEWDYAWRIGQVPIALIKAGMEFDASLVLPGETAEDERERFARIRAWMAECGGAEAALAISPVILLVDKDGIMVLDGWRRIVIAIEQGLTSVHAAIGLSTTPMAADRHEFFPEEDDVALSPGP